MGQYYNACLLDKEKYSGRNTVIEKWVYSHDHKTNHKGNCWGSGLKLMEHSWDKNNFVAVVESLLVDEPKRIVWAGDYADNEKGRKKNLYTVASENEQLKIEGTVDFKAPKKCRYLVNHSKGTFIDKNNVPKDADGWKIHPLPLMSCEGNGRGGGDYRGEDPNGLIGSWARDMISATTRKPKGYTETVFDLT